MSKIIRNFTKDFSNLVYEKYSDNMIIYTSENNKIKYSYSEVETLIKRYSAFFLKKGLKEGDTIVTVLPNSPEAIICFFAAGLNGINYAPVPCEISEREFLNWINITKPKLILKKEGIAEYPTIIQIQNCNCDGNFTWLENKLMDFHSNTTSNIYLMTSGTTGVPKAMSINLDKLWSSGFAFSEYYGILNKNLCFWNYLPMSYLGGLYNLALIPICAKGSFIISEPFSGKTILNYWNFIRNNEITALWFVPSIIKGLLKISKIIGNKKIKNYTENIKICFLGTAPIQLFEKELFEEIFDLKLYENFALSESTFLAAEDNYNLRYREDGSVGKILPYIDFKFESIEGSDKIKQIWIRNPYLFNGYLTQDGNIDLELDSDGFFNTKDLGYLNEDDILILAGRNKDIIKKGGLYVSLIEIENEIRKLTFIEDVVAVPIKHDFYGESYVLFIISNNQYENIRVKEKVHLWMIENFVTYKIPEIIKIVNEFPKTASGKIQKNKLANQLEGVFLNDK